MINVGVCVDCEDGPCKEGGKVDCEDFNPTQTLKLKPNKPKFDKLEICFSCDPNKPCINFECKRSVNKKLEIYKKEIGIDVLIDKNSFKKEFTCPSCDVVIIRNFKFCSECGSRLNWIITEGVLVY